VPYDLGDTVRLIGYSRDPAGALATADTAVLTVTLPDGTTATPTVGDADPDGTYTVDYVTEQPGRHVYRWRFTGPASAHVDVFDVRPAAPLYVISLAEAKGQLNMENTTAKDEQIRRVIEATTTAIEDHIGQVIIRREFTETVRGGGRSVLLTHTPVAELVSLATVDGARTWDVDTLHVDPATGIVESLRGEQLHGRMTAVYTAGPAVIPANVSEAAEIIVQHLWQTTRGTSGAPRPGGMDDSLGVPGLGYALPNAAIELLGDPPPQGG
jgi:hypothetical protein